MEATLADHLPRRVFRIYGYIPEKSLKSLLNILANDLHGLSKNTAVGICTQTPPRLFSLCCCNAAFV